jgi:hypothetical protein
MKRKFNYQQFDIGDWVKVKKQLLVVSGGSERKRIDLPKSSKPIIGRISGVKVLRTGRIEYSWGEGDAEFVHKDTITCWEIRIGILNKPIHAMPEDIELCSVSGMGDLELPVLAGDFSFTWNEQCREDMRKEMAEWPRDKKGRWIKGVSTI